MIVLGMGVSGLAAARFLKEQGIDVIGVDSRDVVTDICPIVKEDTEIIGHDTVVVSPGIPLSHPLCQSGREVINEIGLAAKFIKNKIIIGVTGTNGKTTVALLLEHVLNDNGVKTKAVGNIGHPLIDEIFSDVEVLVVELSSFQLELTPQPFIDLAVILNISSDHLDRHKNIAEYAKAKLNIAKALKTNGKLFVEENCSRELGSLLQGVEYKTFGFGNENLEYMLPVRYKGRKNHDVLNILAVVSLCKELGIEVNGFIESVESFRKPEHRIEFVCEIAGVNYYNDSKATNVDSVICAVDSLDGKIVLIAGGVDKGMNFASWVEAFVGKVDNIVLIGQATEKLENILTGRYIVHKTQTLEEAVQQAKGLARRGENILLSPGCASFDMFDNYAHRGKEFKRIVLSLE
jgi:UDP-N-acetylmuramoylalanine--D-glutamate ligase